MQQQAQSDGGNRKREASEESEDGEVAKRNKMVAPSGEGFQAQVYRRHYLSIIQEEEELASAENTPSRSKLQLIFVCQQI